jgi:hypothetical protein
MFNVNFQDRDEMYRTLPCKAGIRKSLVTALLLCKQGKALVFSKDILH